jgi:hypothetical protein
VADSGCSETCSPYLTDFIPGTMYELEHPLSLGRIAGSLPVTHARRVHWETVDDFGELIEFQTEVYYYPALPGRLLSFPVQPMEGTERKSQGTGNPRRSISLESQHGDLIHSEIR